MVQGFEMPLHRGLTEPATPYQKAAQVWDERMGAARVQARDWRAVAYGCLTLSGVLSAGVVWQAGRRLLRPKLRRTSSPERG